MITLMKPVARDEVSYNVVLLHKVLRAFGMPVAAREVEQSTAGPDTEVKVGALRRQLNIAADTSRLLDDAAAAAIDETLSRRGLTAASGAFTVRGTARREDGSASKYQRLLAFDLDLRGVAVYAGVKTLAEVSSNSGFEFLGETAADGSGNYSVTFYDWQYRRAERKQADVVVFAVQEARDGEGIVGHSRLVASEDYSDQGLVDRLDIVCRQLGSRTEYETLMSALGAFLQESEVAFAEVAVSREQLAFTARELDLDIDRLRIAAAAELLDGQSDQRLSHELLYGMGRQGIALSWTALYKKPDVELRTAIANAVEQKIIHVFSDEEVEAFLQGLRRAIFAHVLNGAQPDVGNALNAVLSGALPKETQRVAFLNALTTFAGGDSSEFWSVHLPAQPEFRDDPQLVANLLLAQQLILLTGDHQPLIAELQVNRRLDSLETLLDVEHDEWLDIVKRRGVPAFVEGTNDDERVGNYARQIQDMLNAAFPTRRIARMVERNQLHIEKPAVAKGIADFISRTAHFDFVTSRIHDFESEIASAAGRDAAEVGRELKRIQRVFQVSASPEAMSALLQRNLHSAYSIANIPRRSFIETYAGSLGGEAAALAIHQRASHIASRTELAAAHMMEYSHSMAPQLALGVGEHAQAMTVLKNKVPNYSNLFGSPDLCECEHCRSVFSAAAYFVDQLRFLWRGTPNADGRTPLDVLSARRPDLLHLPLTCENTNTVIPYIDLANEVMEYYTANDSLTAYHGYDTGDTPADELRARPQHVNLEAYRTIKDATYPFTLPYHQPLDTIRTCSDHLKVSRYEALVAMNPQPDAVTKRTLEAESLRLSEEEYRILTGTAFDGSGDATPVHQYYGYTAASALENLSGVREFLHRSGVAYVDLVELVRTQFINPYQGTLDFLQEIFTFATIDANAIYARLEQIEAGALNPDADADISATLAAYNLARGTSITTAQFGQWVTDHLAEFRQVITLYEPDSKCDLDTTKIRTLGSIYANSASSGVAGATWSRVQSFARLWRKLGWSIHDTDLMLAALGEAGITADTIAKLEAVCVLKTATRLAPDMLATLWGNIDSYGAKSLYKKLFLSRTTGIDQAFKADAWGDYLQDATAVLANHQSSILAAFRMREEDLNAILDVARVIDGGAARALDLATDGLNLPNLSTVYRHVVLAKALKMRIADLCKLIALFGTTPFSIWDIQQRAFVGTSPGVTYEFYQFAAATKDAGFKPTILEYIFAGTVPPDSKIGVNKAAVLGTAKAIRETFSAIEQDHPDSPAATLTPALLTAKLSLTFRPEAVARFMDMVTGSASLEAIAEGNLNVVIPEGLAPKYTYIRGSGRLVCAGIVSDAERAVLQGLANATVDFQDAVDELYEQPEDFIADNFGGIFSDLAQAYATLLDHPAQPDAADLDEKLTYLYTHFLPILKIKLRRDAIAQHLAALLGLSEPATALLIAADVDALITDLSTQGFSATYFSDPGFGNPVLEKADDAIDFAWNGDAPHPTLPADNFSARWAAYLAPPASGEYTLIAEVAEPDEAFNLYLDGTLILEKPAAVAAISWEVVAELNAAQMHRLTLEYAEAAQNAGVRLKWKTATSVPEIIPASSAYPAAVLDRFATRATIWHRAAKFIAGFGLTERELAHFLRFRTDFDAIDFTALSIAHWRRMRDYTQLRDAVPQAQMALTDVFAAANMVNPAPTVEGLKEALRLATAWDQPSLDFLVDTRFGLSVDDFRNEIALDRMRSVMQIVTATGLSAEAIAVWGTATTEFDALDDTAQLLRNTVKAKYQEEDWLQIAAQLSDGVRGRQRDALIGYLLTRPAIRNWGALDADGLFEYLLIDVQMGACMDTSRLVQANSSVQMFVQRCLLNLESNVVDGTERGVSPGAIDQDRWEWMKNYRVWEANRKVFLYPENWLEPEWRNDRSEFFREIESYLVQNDITERSVEQAFRGFLASLNEVANLEVCGTHKESYGDGKLKYLHVVARTHNAPYKFFYRRWDEFRKWSPWEKVPLDIRCVEAGHNSGVHLIPVVWKSRLFLFWPQFAPVAEEASNDGNQSFSSAWSEQMSAYAPRKYWEIRLAWSEYVDGRWSPKQLSKEFIKQYNGPVVPTEASIRWVYRIDRGGLSLYLHIWFESYWVEQGVFHLVDIASPVRIGSSGFATENGWHGYVQSFMSYSKSGALELLGDAYLKKPTAHKVLTTPVPDNYVPRLDDPFFFSGSDRTYFARPVNIPVLHRIRHPASYLPYLPGITGKGRQYVPVERSKISIGDLSSDIYSTMDAVTFAGNISAAADASTAIAMRTGAALSDTDFVDVAQTGAAFTPTYAHLLLRPVLYDKGLEFHTFYHPFSSRYVKRLNQGGLDGLMASDTAIASDMGNTFELAYQPNFTKGLVRRPADFAKRERTYYKENVCFDPYGANSQYNWELFFHAPLYIATRLSKNGKYQEAMQWFHYIFDPTTDAMPGIGESATSRYWNLLPFKSAKPENLEDFFLSLSPNANPDAENAIIAQWRRNPFDPHRVASDRPLAYMKSVVMKYVENLVAWGDSLFRQDTMESVNEALQIYVIANHILGPRPQFVPKRGNVKAESYISLQERWDDFSNALVELENIFPYSSDAAAVDESPGTSLLGIGATLYFGIPPNEKLLEHWDTVADRLYKIRHCQNIDGVERKLALFAPPIDPAALIQAASQGLSLGSILADLSSPPPIYRFSHLIQKANEFCADVKAFGSELLAAIEKRDGEELGRLRAAQETQMLEMIAAIRERQVLVAKLNRENLLKGREAAAFRLRHYVDLLGNDAVTIPAVPTLSASLKADSALPADTTIATLKADIEDSLVDGGERGVKLIAAEKEELDKNLAAKWTTFGAGNSEIAAAVASMFPEFDSEGTPFGVGLGSWWGGQNVSAAASAAARAASAAASFLASEASQAGRLASYIRREQDWTFQANLAARDIVQLDKQITSAAIQIQVAERELQNHQQQIDDARAVEQFLKNKFSNQELYQWMREQLFSVYKQSYNLAYDMAKKAEKAYKYERGTQLASFVQYGYWDNSKQGLVAGEKLQLALRQLEKSYFEENVRELELSKSISLARLDPLALIELRETGRCYLSVPEELFDLDFRGHYFRRIKAVRLSIPCVTGPYTSIGCSLRLLNNAVRVDTTLNSEGNYEHENDAGLWVDDDRFRNNLVPVTAIAASSAQNDPGMFEFSFRDERYLPFEGAGAISEWQIELSTDRPLRQFDYATISDVILHMDYTARENGGLFKEKATAYLQDFIANTAERAEQPLMQLFSMRHEFPTEWHRFLRPGAQGAEQNLSFTPGKERFTFFAQDRDIVVQRIDVFACSTQAAADYHASVSYVDHAGDTVTSDLLTLPQTAAYAGVNRVTINATDAGFNLEEMDISGPMSLKLKRTTAQDYTSLTTNPEELSDVLLVIHYRLAGEA